jgi:alpha-mannosidase
MTTRKPLYYTFGNHMHWVDMQWLWGYEVLPGSVRDMLHLCRETGAKGCVNFDAVGYEKMAAECPEALAELREAVAAGTIEPVGCSYGQPYGLFQGGESNIRQFTYGVRTTRRLLGVRPRTFWEEEFYFFPQLPQVLASCGYTGANLFFQWTWHTPEVPKEAASLILWEGADGTRIPTLPRNTLNVHQWPEDFDGLLEQGLINELERPAIVQWLELMPSKDWMCRSEVLLPRLRELFGDARFEVRARTCGEMIAELSEAARQRGGETGGEAIPVRAYSMDEVWHGMTLGKNADRHPRRSREVEHEILAAESLAAMAGLFGRPYASWDVYPTWELDEAWRELLAAQHHDNHECEGLCGFVAEAQMRKGELQAEEVLGRSRTHLEQRCSRSVIGNALGWVRTIEAIRPDDERDACLITIPPFGFTTAQPPTWAAPPAQRTVCEGALTITRGELRVEVDTDAGRISQLWSAEFPEGLLDRDQPLFDLRQIVAGRSRKLPAVSEEFSFKVGPDSEALADMDHACICFEEDELRPDETPRVGVRGFDRRIILGVSIEPTAAGVDCQIGELEDLTRPDPGFTGALRMPVRVAFSVHQIRADTPYSVEACDGTGIVSRKYPQGDWMTSPQWFEHVEGAITAHSFIDLLDASGAGLLILHDGSQQWFRTDGGVDVILNAYCPWDEARYAPECATPNFRLIPHGPLRDADRVRLAREFADDGKFQLERWFSHSVYAIPVGGGDRSKTEPIPESFGALEVTNAPGVLAHAFFRESPKSGEHLPDWAGHRMAAGSGGACTHPYVARLVEWNGEAAEVVLKLPGPVAMAAKTNMMGECGDWAVGRAPADAPAHLRDTGWLSPEPATPPEWAEGATLGGRPIPWSQVRFPMRPREIATVMADLVMGRKQFRDLDAKREVWATVHRTGE